MAITIENAGIASRTRVRLTLRGPSVSPFSIVMVCVGEYCPADPLMGPVEVTSPAFMSTTSVSCAAPSPVTNFSNTLCGRRWYPSGWVAAAESSHEAYNRLFSLVSEPQALTLTYCTVVTRSRCGACWRRNIFMLNPFRSSVWEGPRRCQILFTSSAKRAAHREFVSNSRNPSTPLRTPKT